MPKLLGAQLAKSNKTDALGQDRRPCPRLVLPQAAAISWSGESGPRHRPREQDRDGRGEETHK